MAERIVEELPDRGQKVVDCLRTAAVLIGQAVEDGQALRLAESAGYNLREALEAVVVGRAPVSGGLPAILEAWDRYQLSVGQEESDRAAALTALEDVLQRVAEKRDRSSLHAARLLDYLRAKTGVDPLPGDLDPVSEYSGLRTEANAALHSASALDAVTALYDRTIAWFIRMFTPPDAVVQALVELAVEPWRDVGQIDRLRALATNPHHLRLFLGRLTDHAWLSPLYDAAMVPLPQPGMPWPATALLDGLGRTSPAEVAGLIERMLADSKGLPKAQQPGARFELLRMASQLGGAGHTVTGKVVELHRDSQAVRALAAGVAKRASASDVVVEQIADAVLNGKPLDREQYHATVLLDQLEAGLNAANVSNRMRMLAAKVRRVARDPEMRVVALDIAKLTAEVGDHPGFAIILVHRFAKLLARARELGVPSADLLTWTANIPGAVGERITCRIMADADDVPLLEKINHISRRLASSTATGDDRDLVDNIMAAKPETAMLDVWTQALGTPSAALSDPEAAPPRDWAKAWRWSRILPEHVLAQWQEAIAQVSAKYGSLEPETLDRRSELPEMLTGRSAYSEEQLVALPVLDAAALVSAWRPDATSNWNLIGARELARTLESVVKADPDEWSKDPTGVVTALREPVYVLHYFRALTSQAAAITARASSVLDAAALARESRWEPIVLGRDNFDFEPNWSNVDAATVDLAGALANRDAELTAYLDTVWAWALEPIRRSTDEGGSFEDDDALTRAINNPRGLALEAVLAFAGWERRNTGAVRAEFFNVLDDAIGRTGRLGMEYRAILAHRRVFLEGIARDWFDKNATTLFGADERGRETFNLTLKYAQPTEWFYSRFRVDLFAAARRDAGRAIRWLLVAALREQDGYTVDAIIDGIGGKTAALASASNEMAFLAQTNELTEPQLAIAIQFWQAMLKAERNIVPAEAFQSCGRWALVKSMSYETWSELMVVTLDLTGGMVDLPMEVADRCKDEPTSANSPKILLQLLGKGEPWEHYQVARTAIEVLQANAAAAPDANLQRLRMRLIELGYHEAADIAPDEGVGNGG